MLCSWFNPCLCSLPRKHNSQYRRVYSGSQAWGLLLCWGRARMTQQEQPVLSLAKLYANQNSTRERYNLEKTVCVPLSGRSCAAMELQSLPQQEKAIAFKRHYLWQKRCFEMLFTLLLLPWLLDATVAPSIVAWFPVHANGYPETVTRLRAAPAVRPRRVRRRVPRRVSRWLSRVC